MILLAIAFGQRGGCHKSRLGLAYRSLLRNLQNFRTAKRPFQTTTSTHRTWSGLRPPATGPSPSYLKSVYSRSQPQFVTDTNVVWKSLHYSNPDLLSGDVYLTEIERQRWTTAYCRRHIPSSTFVLSDRPTRWSAVRLAVHNSTAASYDEPTASCSTDSCR
jgi:hypothetical protein